MSSTCELSCALGVEQSHKDQNLTVPRLLFTNKGSLNILYYLFKNTTAKFEDNNLRKLHYPLFYLLNYETKMNLALFYVVVNYSRC